MQGSNDQHNRFGEFIFISSMGVVFILIGYLSFFHKGIDLKENIRDPKEMEQVAPEPVIANIDDVQEPWVPNEKVVAYGRQLFKANCAMCHGPKGEGDGSAGQALNPKPRNLVEGKWQHGGGYMGIFKVLTNGIPGSSMAAYANMKASDRWALTQYVNSITENKVAEEAAAIAEFAKTAN